MLKTQVFKNAEFKKTAWENSIIKLSKNSKKWLNKLK